MSRIVIERQELYALLEERFREHRSATGCQVCKTPYPFFCDASNGVNWRVAVLPQCERSCRTMLAGIVDEMSKRYQLTPPLWRTYHRQFAAAAVPATRISTATAASD